jgi:hypothetical protein
MQLIYMQSEESKTASPPSTTPVNSVSDSSPSTVFDEGGEKEKIEEGIISFSFSLLTYIL